MENERAVLPTNSDSNYDGRDCSSDRENIDVDKGDLRVLADRDILMEEDIQRLTAEDGVPSNMTQNYGSEDEEDHDRDPILETRSNQSEDDIDFVNPRDNEPSIDSPIIWPRARYRGACNIRTIKDGMVPVHRR